MSRPEVGDTDILAGSRLAIELEPITRAYVSGCLSRAHWWAGFLSALAGMARADIGADGVKAILAALSGMNHDEVPPTQRH